MEREKSMLSGLGGHRKRRKFEKGGGGGRSSTTRSQGKIRRLQEGETNPP